MSRQKVIHLITRLELGGAQQNTLYTAAHLDPARWEVTVASGRGGMLDAEQPVHFLDNLVHPLSPLRDLLALFELSAFFRREKPALVHTHSSKAGILGRLAAALAGVRAVVHTFHGFGFNDRQGALTRTVYIWAEKFAAMFTDALVFVSKSNMETARTLGIGDPRKYRLIRSGVKLSGLPAEPLDKATLGLGQHKPHVVTVGNFKPQKNPVDFLVLAEKVLEKNRDARFVFVGDGPLRDKMEANVLLKGLGGKVALTGWRRDAARILAASEVFVLTSLWEGLPRALVEAMKSGLPPVCYATDGVLDLVRDGVNGYIVAQGDVQGMAEKVNALLTDPALRKKLGQAAAASIGPEFDIDGMVRAQEELYASLL